MKIILLIFSLFVVVSCKIPKSYGKREIVYKYKADFRTGVINENIPGTQFVLKADLHAQFNVNSKLRALYFENTEISVFSGEIPMYGENLNENFIPIPITASDFENPFLIDDDEYSSNIFTSKNEAKWIVNMKKSIASLFYFDWNIFEEKSKNETIYSVHEDTTYGDCLVTFNLEQNDDEWIVERKQNINDCSYAIRFITSQNENSCDNEFTENDDYLIENERTYIIDNNQDKKFDRIFKKIEANGKVLMFPYVENGDLRYVNVQQTVEFVGEQKSIKKIKDRNLVSHNLQVTFDDYEEIDLVELFDVAEQTSLDKPHQNNIEECALGIEALTANLSDSEINNKIVKQLRHLTIEELKECLNGLGVSTPSFKIFYQILPMVGTKASCNLIKNIFIEDPESLSDATILQLFPFYILNPTEELLEDLKEFIDKNDEVVPIVKSSAILAYATIIYKTFQHKEESPILDTYINTYYDNLRTAKTFDDQIIWLQGLSNIQIGNVWKLLIPLIRGDDILELEYDQSLIVHVIRSVDISIIKEHQADFLNILWPIITNQTNGLDIRVTALKLYIKGCTTSTDINKLFWYMQSEKNIHVYNYFKTSMESIVTSNNYCKSPIYNYIKQLNQHTKNFGLVSETVSYSHVNYDKVLGLGGRIHGDEISSIITNRMQSFYLEFDVYAMRKSFKLFSYYKKYKQFYDKSDENVDVNEILSINNKIVYTNVDTKPGESSGPFMSILFPKTKNEELYFILIMDLLNSNKMIPSDLGLPIVFTTKMPVITGIFHNSDNGLDSIKVHQHLNGQFGTTIHNPFINVYHGIISDIQFKLNLPIYFNFSKGTTFKFNDYSDENYISFDNKINTIVFLSHATDSNILFDICNNCNKDISTNTNEKSNTEVNKYLSEIGFDYKHTSTECIDNTALLNSDLFNKLLVAIYPNSLYDELRPFFSMITLKYSYIFKCNNYITLIPSESNRIDNISLNSIKRVAWINITSSTLKPIKWAITAKPDYQYHKESITFKFIRMVEGEPNLIICYDQTETQKDYDYEAIVNLYQGYSYDQECVKDDVFIQIIGTGKRSEEQEDVLEDYDLYKHCNTNNKYNSNITTLASFCIIDYTSLRSFSYDIEYQNIPDYYNKFFYNLWNLMKQNNQYDFEYNPKAKLNSNKISIDVNIPINYDYSYGDLNVHLSEGTYTIYHVDYFYYWGMLNEFATLNVYYDCATKIHDDVIMDNHYRKLVKIPQINEWILFTKYVKDENENIIAVYVKSIDDEKLAARVMINNHTLTVHLDDNDKFLYEMDEIFFGNKNIYEIRLMTIKNTFVFYSSYFHFYLVFDGKYLKSSNDDYGSDEEKDNEIIQVDKGICNRKDM